MGLRDRSSDFLHADCIILGASFDTPAENKAFANAQGFDYQLLSDVDRKVGTLYEVIRAPDEQNAGFPLRIAYLVGPDGLIRKAYAVTDVSGFATEVLADLETLQHSA